MLREGRIFIIIQSQRGEECGLLRGLFASSGLTAGVVICLPQQRRDFLSLLNGSRAAVVCTTIKQNPRLYANLSSLVFIVIGLRCCTLLYLAVRVRRACPPEA